MNQVENVIARFQGGLLNEMPGEQRHADRKDHTEGRERNNADPWL